jgi:hypothetical protein
MDARNMDDRNSARRKLLKGALAAPAVFAVRPASAQAMNSVVACMARDAQKAALPPRPAELVAGDADDWVRMRLELYELQVFQGSALKTLPGRYFIGSDRSTYWRILDARAGMMGARAAPMYVTASQTNFTVGSVAARATGESRYALVFFDSAGGETGFAWERNGGNPLTSSCFTSLRPTAAL